MTPVDPLNSIEGFQLVNTEVGAFTFDIAPLFPPGTVLPAGLPASLFTATYDWGDGTSTAATVTQDANNPSVYTVTGNHTYLDPGLFPTALTVSFVGGSVTGVVNGVPISLTLPPSTATPAGPTSAVVTDGILAVTAFPIVGVEGIAIPSGPIATFIDAGGSDLLGDYSASIAITDSNGFSLILPAASITQVGNSAQYTVIAPDITLPEAGTYQIQVTVTDNGQLGPIVATGASTAVIADAALTPDAPVLQVGNTGILLSGFGVGSFTDGNPNAPVTDFTGTIDWGDGSPNSVALFAPGVGAGAFNVSGSHTYAKPGVYNVTTTVIDEEGKTTTLNASFTITDLPVTGETKSFTAVEGQNTGPFVLATFEDPNTLATVADVKAELAIGGWGDGTPGVAGIQLAVEQIGVNPTTGNPIFQVIGSHTYAEEALAPYTLSVIITTSGGVQTTLTSLPGGGVTVQDAALSAQGSTIAAIEGQDVTDALVATFTDLNPGATVADFTTNGGVVTVDWGDGTVSSTSPIPGQGSVSVTLLNGVFSVRATKPPGPGLSSYGEKGTFQITVTVLDEGGSSAVAHSQAIVGDADLALVGFNTIGVPEGTTVSDFNLIQFADANPLATTNDFTATIDWGDGSPFSVGTVTQPGGVGSVFSVLGTHTYTEEGGYTITVTVLDRDGAHPLVVQTGASITDANLSAVPTQPTVAATEGLPFSNAPVSYFVDPNIYGGVSDFSATIDWGANASVPTTTGVVQLVGHTAPGAPVAGLIYQVIGSNTYLEEGISTITVTIDDVGGAPTLVTTTTATTADAALSAHGTSIQAVEGQPVNNALVATFTDANPIATVADFTTNGGVVTVDWGDGTVSSTSPIPGQGTVTVTLSGGVFSVTASKPPGPGLDSYVEEGSYQITVTIHDEGGSEAIAHGEADVADARLAPSQLQPIVVTTESPIFPVPEFGAPIFTGQVAAFTDANPLAPVSDFHATIDWGDNTAQSAGWVTQPGGPGTTFYVSGSHTYTDAGVNGGTGHRTITVNVFDEGGSVVQVTNDATINDNPIVLTGVLNPYTDSGVSNTDAITNVKQPDFYGQSEPLSNVKLIAIPADGGSMILLGQTEAGSDGSWNIRSGVPLADGHYKIIATAVDQFGKTATASPTVVTPDLFIDTRGPVVTGVVFNRMNGQVGFRIQDPNQASGVLLASLLDASNYEFTKVHAQKNFPGQWIVTNVTATPDPSYPNTYDVAVTFNGGRAIAGGFYLFRLRDSTSGSSSVRDIAGNHLDGEFYGSFPSGNGVNGGDFVAEFQTYHNKIFAPQTIIGTSNPRNRGVGGNPVGPVHSGVWVPVVPRGGRPMYSTSTSPTAPPVAVPTTPPSVFNVRAAHSVFAARLAHAKLVLQASSTHPSGPRHSVWVPVVPRGRRPMYSTSTRPTAPPVAVPTTPPSVFNVRAAHSVFAARLTHAKLVLQASSAHPRGPRHR